MRIRNSPKSSPPEGSASPLAVDSSSSEPFSSTLLSHISLHSLINTILIIFLIIYFYYSTISETKFQQKYHDNIIALHDEIHTLEQEVLFLSDNTTTKEILTNIEELHQNLKELEIQTDIKLADTKQVVNTRLDNAVVELDKAVSDAEQKIKDQVAEVRDDMAIYISVTNQQLSAESDFIKYEIAGTFTLLACLISMWHVWGHLRHFAKPSVQRRIVAILAMVPIYSITSWLSLVFPSSEPTLSTIRDCYEAYMIYTFIAFLIAILGEERGLTAAVNIFAARLMIEEKERQQIEEEKERYEQKLAEEGSDEESQVQLLKNQRSLSSFAPTRLKYVTIQPPFYCCADKRTLSNPHTLAASVLDQCQALAMQFVLLKPLLALVPFILETSGVAYTSHNIVTETHQIDWSSPKLYIYFVLNISVALAFYGLMTFYQATEKQLAWCDPWPKFLCIKGIVFMTFWQGIAITGMSIAGIVDEKSALAAQNMLICIEMLLASIMHHLFFPYQEWQEVVTLLNRSDPPQGYKKEKEREMMNLKDLLAFRDFIGDVKGIITRRAWEGVNIPGVETPTSAPRVTRGSSYGTSRQVELIESVLDDILDESSHETHNLV